MLWVRGPNDDCDSLLQRPAQHDLGGGDLVGLGRCDHDGISHHRAPCATQRRPRLKQDLVLLAERKHVVLVFRWIPLYLIDLNWLLGSLHGHLQLCNVVVGHADALHNAPLLEILHGSPGILQISFGARLIGTVALALWSSFVEAAHWLDRERKVDQKQVDVSRTFVGELTQHLEVVVGTLNQSLVSNGPWALGGDKDLLSWHCLQSRRDVGLSPIVIGGVDVRSTDPEPVLHGKASMLLSASPRSRWAVAVASGPCSHGNLRNAVTTYQRGASHLGERSAVADLGHCSWRGQQRQKDTTHDGKEN
mmetsp:Transcript_7686/g.14335  ORF Transcript_7686/g.14335 Transcript_7686/m.14335 type:complete len:306 (+) Transcript_7686:160-1077(+)